MVETIRTLCWSGKIGSIVHFYTNQKNWLVLVFYHRTIENMVNMVNNGKYSKIFSILPYSIFYRTLLLHSSVV